MAGEIERLHRAGAKWRTFAVLYRSHAHRDKLVEALKARKIPFVIKNLSILSHRLVRDLIAYLRLIDQTLGRRRLRARAGDAGVGPGALGPGAPRGTRRERARACPCGTRMQAAQGEPPFSGGERHLGELVELDYRTAKESPAA